MKYVLCGIVVVVALVGLIFAIDYAGLQWYSFIGPKRENVRRQIFEQTKSYNQGQQQELLRLSIEFKRSKDPIEKKAIAGMVRHEFSDYAQYRLSPEMQIFVSECMNTF